MLSESMIFPEVLYFGCFIWANNPTRDILFTMAMIVARVARFILLDFRLAIPPVAGRETRVVLFGTIRDGVDCVFSRFGH